MEFIQDLRVPMPGIFESPSLTRVGRIQRGITTSVLCIFPLLQAIQWQWRHNSFKSGFRCKVRDGEVETRADEDLTVQRLAEYAEKYTVVSQGLFLLYLISNLLVFCLYMSYVSERFSAWFKLKTVTQRWKTSAELKVSSVVFFAHLVQLGWRLILAVSFVLYNCLAHSVVLPFEREFESERTPIPFILSSNVFITKCSSDQAFESSMFNIALLTFAVFCGTLSLTELIYTWQETKGFERISDYYFCMFLLRQNGVTDTMNMLIEKELFLEEQENILKKAKAELVGFPLFTAKSSMPNPVFRDIFIYQQNLKYKGVKKQKHKHELFRTYSKAKKLPIHCLQDLFKAGKDAADLKRILVVGEPGIGKTEFAFQLTKNFGAGRSSSRSQHRNLNFVFSFSFKELDLVDEFLTLQEFLQYSSCSSKVGDTVYRHIVENPEEVLVIFDGLNEWGVKTSMEHACASIGETEDEMSPTSLILKLISGELLCGSTVVVTSRPTPLLSEIREIIAFDRCVELGCFKPKELQEYVQGFFQDENDLGGSASDRILGDDNVKVLCSLPQNCFLLCWYIHFLASSKTNVEMDNIQLPTTTTELFERIIDVSISKHVETNNRSCQLQTQELPEISQQLINKISHLAFEGAVKDKFVFRKEDISFAELSPIEVDSLVEAGFLRRLSSVVTPDQTGEDSFCFSQLTMQEFLAARRIVQSTTLEEFRDFLGKANETHCMTLQFVAGLCKDNKGRGNTFVCLMQYLTGSIQLNSLVDEPAIDHQGIVFLCKCLFENKTKLGHPFGREATSALRSKRIVFADVGTSPQETQAILHCIREATGDNVKKVTIESSTFGDYGFRQVASSVCEGACRLDQVSLTRSNITDNGMLSFLEISASHSHLALKVLGLRGNGISSEGAKYLACVLFNDWCCLEEVHLGGNKIGDLGVQYFSEALCSDNCKIHTLDLSSNGITHNGVYHLREALSNPTCSVRTLYLQKNKIMDVGMEDLCEALCTGECNLRVLFASSNEITDKGIKFVEKALAHKSCNLQELYLGYNKVTDKGVKSLLQALPTHQFNLKVLSLANNPITDAGVKMLANALRNSSCNLRRLCISLGRPQVAATKASKLQVRYVNAF